MRWVLRAAPRATPHAGPGSGASLGLACWPKTRRRALCRHCQYGEAQTLSCGPCRRRDRGCAFPAPGRRGRSRRHWRADSGNGSRKTLRSRRRPPGGPRRSSDAEHRCASHSLQVVFGLVTQAFPDPGPRVVGVVEEIQLEIRIVDVVAIEALGVLDRRWWTIVTVFGAQPPVGESVPQVILLVERSSRKRDEDSHRAE